MNNERIDLTKELEWLHRLVKIKQVPELNKHDVIVDSIWIEGLIAELKRCYEMIDAMQGNVPYVEYCEECGATDGGDAEGCDYCGIIHYQSEPRGFYHKDSPKR